MDGARLNGKFQIYSICYTRHFSFNDNSLRAAIIFLFQVVLTILVAQEHKYKILSHNQRPTNIR